MGTTFLAVTGRRSRGPDRLMRRMAVLDVSGSPSGAGVALAGRRGWPKGLPSVLGESGENVQMAVRDRLILLLTDRRG